MDIIKNPIILAVIGGSVTYYYMQYKIDETNKIRKKKGKKPEELNLLIPLVVTFAIWFLAYMYFNSEKQPIPNSIILAPQQQTTVLDNARQQVIQKPMQIPMVQNYRYTKDVQSSPINIGGNTSESYEIINHNNLKVPEKIKDFNDLI